MRTWLRRHLSPSRHTLYFQVLEALGQEGCPLCRLASGAVAWYTDMLSYEAVNDPGVRARLRAARGFCNYHAWRFAADLRNAPGRAMIYRDLLGVLLAILRRGPGAQGEHLLPTGECPACRSLAQATGRYLDTLLAHLGEEELRSRYQASSGLCLPHLRLALRRTRRTDEVELLLGVATRWAWSLRVASRDGLAGHTRAVVAGAVGLPGISLPEPSDDVGAKHWPTDAVRADSACRPMLRPYPVAADADDGACPVCRAAVVAAEARLLSLPGEVKAAGREPGPALGLCSPHAWRSLELLAPGAAARLWQPGARALKGLLAAEHDSGSRDGGPHDLPAGRRQAGPGAAAAGALATGDDCPACRAQVQAELRSVESLLREDTAAAAGQASSLCLPHFALALRLSPQGGGRESLVMRQEIALLILRTELDEYIRKQHYLNREQPGDEADSPWRAMARVTGAEGLAAGALGWCRMEGMRRAAGLS